MRWRLRSLTRPDFRVVGVTCAALAASVAGADNAVADADDGGDDSEMVLVLERGSTAQFTLGSGDTIEVSGTEYVYAPRSELVALGTDSPTAAQLETLSCTKSYSNYGTGKYFTSGGTIVGAGGRVQASSGCSSSACSYHLLQKERWIGWENVSSRYNICAAPGQSVPTWLEKNCTGTTYNWRSYVDQGGHSASVRYAC